MKTFDRKISKKSSVERTIKLLKTTGFKLQVTFKVTSDFLKTYIFTELNSHSVYDWFYRLSPRVVGPSFFAIIYVSLRKRVNEDDQN